MNKIENDKYKINKNSNQNDKNKKLEIIPKLEHYTQYILELILKLPRTEKYSIGTEYKTSLYKTINYVMYLNKIEESKCLYYANLIDAEINTQRIYLRIMYKNKWIDQKKFNFAMAEIYEIGKILRRINKILCQKQ